MQKVFLSSIDKKSIVQKLSWVFIASIMLLFSSLTINAAQVSETDEYARISYMEGNGTIYHGFNHNDEQAFIDSTLVQGDTLETHDGTLAELIFANGIIIRMNENSKINLLSLENKNYSAIIVRFYEGDIFVDSIIAFGNEGSFRIDTPDCGIFLVQQGYFRIIAGQYTDIMVYDGVVEVATEQYIFSLASSQRLFNAASPESQPEYFNTTIDDDFSNWSVSRMEQYIDQEMNDEYAEITEPHDPAEPDIYIDWIYEPAYGTPQDIFSTFIPFGRFWYNPGEYDPNKPYYNDAGFNRQSCNNNRGHRTYPGYTPIIENIVRQRENSARKKYDNKPVAPSHGTNTSKSLENIQRGGSTYSPQSSTRNNSGNSPTERQRPESRPSSGSTPAKKKK